MIGHSILQREWIALYFRNAMPFNDEFASFYVPDLERNDKREYLSFKYHKLSILPFDNDVKLEPLLIRSVGPILIATQTFESTSESQ